MLNLKLSSASSDKIQRARNQVKGERCGGDWFAIRLGGPFLDAI
jgi:hypothetical protein